MAKIISIQATLSKNVNKIFRTKSKLIHFVKKPLPLNQIPVIINNFNRFEWLQQQIDWLKSIGQNNIHVIDNASSYSPLLAYYKKIPATVYLLDRNIGHEAIWRTHIYQRFMKDYYIYTDPDVLPAKDTPKDFMQYFMDILIRNSEIDKVGFGLKTDDIPDHYPKKEEVIKWENSLLTNEIEPGIFKAKIDTTFALYKPGKSYQCWENTLRTDAPYLLRHMPWYEDPKKLNSESEFYMNAASSSSSWYKSLKGENDTY